jgi:hypothetical protein
MGGRAATIFDLLFIFIFLATTAALATSIFQVIRGHHRKSLRVLSVSAVSLAVYFAICCAVTLRAPRRILNIHEPQCLDDWCVSLENVIETRDSSSNRYVTNIRIFSQAKRISQRENGIAFYLEDDLGHRYAAITSPSDIPSNSLLQPGESVILTRGFQLPSNVQAAGFVATHEGGFPIQWFVIGEGQSLFHKEPITRLQ